MHLLAKEDIASSSLRHLLHFKYFSLKASMNSLKNIRRHDEVMKGLGLNRDWTLKVDKWWRNSTHMKIVCQVGIWFWN